MTESASHIQYMAYTGAIDANGATRIATAFNACVNGGVTDVHFCFNSTGGFVADGIYLYNHLRGLPLTIWAYNLGSVSSIAVAIFVAADRRFCSRHSAFMIHPTSIPLQEGVSAERANAILGAALADDMRTESILRERTGLTDDLLNARRYKDVLIDADTALAEGIVERIVEFELPPGNQIVQI